MGKRELLLIVAFLVVGAAVYYATAPPGTPNQQGFSVSRILDSVRRELHGNRASSEVKTTTAVPLKSSITEVRLDLGNGSTPITIIGEERDDVTCDLDVWSNGYDEAEARKYATDTKLRVSDGGGTTLLIGIVYPEPGQQRATLELRIPSRLAVRIQPSRGKIDIGHVASAEIVEARGQVTIKDVAGRLVVNHRGGPLTVENVAGLKLSARGSTIVLKDVKGEANLQTQAGELRGSGLAGPIEIESNGTKIVFDDLTETRRTIRINATNGAITLAGVRVDTRIDGRDTQIDVAVDRPAPIAIYNESDEPIHVTLPAGGFQLDALATDGRLTVPEGLIEVTSNEHEQRAAGPLHGGGPTLTVRSSRGNIQLRSADR